MMWETPVPIFEDEDEDQLISEFVRLSALYPTYSAYEVAQVVFKGLKDPIMRANQAAMQWSSDLTIKERIRKAALVGANQQEIDSKETKLRKLEAIYNDPNIKAADRIKALELHAKISGDIDGDGDDDKKAGGGVVLNFIRREDPVSDAA